MTEEASVCFNCGHATPEPVKKCPNCGRGWRTPKQIRRLGWLQLAIGLFLVGLMGTITYNVAPTLLPTGAPAPDGAHFNGTPEQAQLILGLFSLVIIFGLGSMASGLWQIKTGRRNKWLFIVMVLLFIGLLLLSWFIRKSLGS